MGNSYSRVWVFVLAHLDEKTSYNEIAQFADISKSQAFRIIQWGVETMRSMEINVATRVVENRLIISVGQTAKVQVQKETPKQTKPNNSDLINDIIGYLNNKTGRQYTTKAKDALRAINARISEGYALDDFKKVIDIKAEKWMGTEYEDYLRPITLFGTKFNSYINERPQQQQNSQSAIAKAIAVATQVADELGGGSEE
jgi:uncharacterized phage protein (TIGR02220 family)